MICRRLTSRLALVLFAAALATALATGGPALAAAPGGDVQYFVKLAQDAGPAVVNINTIKTISPQPQQRGSGPMGRFRGPSPDQRDPFEDFFDQFDRFFGGRGGQGPRKQRSLGSGFAISGDGFIVTNNHVVEDADEIRVTFHEGRKNLKAKIIGRDQETDLALIKIEADSPVPFLKFGSSENMKVGEWVVAIGNPFGLEQTVTAGILSAKGRIIGAGAFDNFLQTDASINPGNSGGPLLNLNGEVIGINSAIVATGQGIGFAIPSDMARDIIEKLRTGGKVERGWLGVTIQDLDEATAKALGLKEAKGALVSSALPGEPAAKAGLQPGDVITAVNGKPVADASELLRAIAGLKPGEKVKLDLLRDGKSRTVTAELGVRKAEQQTEARQPSGGTQEERLGLSVKPVTPQEAQSLGLDKAAGLVVVDVTEGSPASEQDIQPGDVITSANQKPVNTVEEFKGVLSDAKNKGVLLLLVNRRGMSRFVSIPMDTDKK